MLRNSHTGGNKGIIKWNSDTKTLLGLKFATLYTLRNLKDLDLRIQGLASLVSGFLSQALISAFSLWQTNKFKNDVKSNMYYNQIIFIVNPLEVEWKWPGMEVTCDHLANIPKFRPYKVRKFCIFRTWNDLQLYKFYRYFEFTTSLHLMIHKTSNYEIYITFIFL